MTATPAPPQSSTDYEAQSDGRFLPPPELWAAAEPLLPEPPGSGRLRKPDRQMFAAICYLLTEGHGLPVGLVVTGANRHDMTQVGAVLDARPVVSFEGEQHLCADGRAGVRPPGV